MTVPKSIVKMEKLSNGHLFVPNPLLEYNERDHGGNRALPRMGEQINTPLYHVYLATAVKCGKVGYAITSQSGILWYKLRMSPEADADSVRW